MLTGKSQIPNDCRIRENSNSIAVAQAIEGLVSAGFATMDREVESCQILHLLSGEIFMLAGDCITRIW